MTPLDRVLDLLPGAREILLGLDAHLPLILAGAIVSLILLVLLWTFVSAPRRAVRALERLAAEGYHPVNSGDPHLAEALARLTPIVFHTYDQSTVTEISPWRVKRAVARRDGEVCRYHALIHRSVSRAAVASTKLEHQFTIAFLERRPLPFAQDVYVAGDRYRLDPRYGLRAVPESSLGRLSSSYVFHTASGTLEAVPPGLEAALVEVAPFLSIAAAPTGRKAPFLFHARLRFTVDGWALISNEYVYDPRKLAAFVEVVDRISDSLS